MAPRRACQSYNLSLSGCRNDGNGARVKPVVGRRERGLPHRSLRLGALAYFWKRKNCFIELSPDVSKGLHTLLAVFWKPLLSGLTGEHPCLPAFLPPRLGWCNICTAPFLAFKMCLTLHLFIFLSYRFFPVFIHSSAFYLPHFSKPQRRCQNLCKQRFPFPPPKLYI